MYCLLLQNPTLNDGHIPAAIWNAHHHHHHHICYQRISDLNVSTCVHCDSMSAVWGKTTYRVKTLQHVNMYVRDFSNHEDSDCCLFMIMQYPCPSEEAGQILSAPMIKTHTPPTLWNYIKHAIWLNQRYIMGFFPWGWGYGEKRTRVSSRHPYKS